MTEEQLNKVIEALSGTVQSTVNGKIDKLQGEVEAIRTEVAEQKKFHEELRGLLDLKRAGLTLQGIAKWLKDMGIYVFIGWEIMRNIR